MAIDAAALRYAQALFAAAKAAKAVDPTLEQLAVLRKLIREHPLLREFFLNPDVDMEDKVGMLDRVTQKTWSDLVRAYMRMVVSLGRAQLLDDIVDAFQSLVDADQKRIHVMVRSPRKLSAESRGRLIKILEKREGKIVELKEELDPSLIGGLQIYLGHRVIDGSVHGQLSQACLDSRVLPG